MTRYNRGDVVLVPFPFANTLDAKKRPAVVVSSAQYMADNIDLLVAMVTSRVRVADRVGDHPLKDWQAAGLIGPSRVRAHIATVDQRRVVKKIGTVTPGDMTAIDRGLRLALAL